LTKDPHRHLAGDARAGTFARRKARQDQRTYVRKNWKWLVGGYLTLVSIVTVPVLLLEHRAFVRGLVLGLTLAGVAGALVNMIVIQTGTGPTMAGELAEQWTAQELRKLTPHGYRLANHVDVDGRGDADHVLVGPGGLFVLETKWSATEWTPEDRFFAMPLAQARGRARNTWLQVKRHGVEQATPVLVLWGKAAKEIAAGPGVRRNGDTFVVAGSHLHRWLSSRPGGVLSPEQVSTTYRAVCDIAARGDKVALPVPPSIGRLYTRALTTLAVGSAAFTVPLLFARFGLWFYVTAAVALTAAGIGAGRVRRFLGLVVIAGALGSLAVGAVALAVAYGTT
jgi:hypothetical protein